MPGYYHMNSAIARLVAENVSDKRGAGKIAQWLMSNRPFGTIATLVITGVLYWVLAILSAGMLADWFFGRSVLVARVLTLIAVAIILHPLKRLVRDRVFMRLRRQSASFNQ